LGSSWVRRPIITQVIIRTITTDIPITTDRVIITMGTIIRGVIGAIIGGTTGASP